MTAGLIRVVVLALAYFAAGWLGLQIPYVGSHITLVWLPTGIAVAALFRWGWGVWPGILLGAFFVNLSIGSSLFLATSIAVGNTLGPLLTTAWLKRAKFHGAFDRRKDVGSFISAASAGMTVSASCGVSSLYLAGLMAHEPIGSAWLSWWMGDTVGVLLAAPFLLTLSRASVGQLTHSRRELLLWVLVAGPMAWLAFIYNYEQMGRSLPLVFLTLPLVAWIALRFGSTGAGLAGLGFSVLAAWGTAAGYSPFLLSDVHTSLFLLWSYMATIVLTGLLITALQAERLLAESTLRASEARFRYMLETSPIAVRIASSSGRNVLFANQRYAELIEAPADEVIGVDPKLYYAHPQEYEDVLERLSQGERVTDKLVELHLPGGKEKWALASYLTLDYGNESAVLGWFYDITERTQMETALRDSEARLVAAQQIARLGNWELDLATNRLWWSEEIFRIFEIDADVFGASYEAFIAAIHPDDRQAVNQAYLDSLENKTPYEIEHRLLFQDGRVKYVHERCETEFGPDGKALRSMGTVQDITERKLAETALQRSEATSRALINATMETAILLDENGTIIAINEVGAHRLLKEQHEIVGTNFYELLPPELAQSRKSVTGKVFQSGTAAHFQDIRNGIRFDINVYPVFDVDGKVVNLAVYAADVTEQHQLQGVDQLLHGIDQQVLRGQSIQNIFEFICVEVARIFGYQYIWLGRKESQGEVSILADAGPASGYRAELERVGVRWDDTPQGKGPTGTTIRTGHAQVFNISDAGFQPWYESARRHKLNAVLGLPLIIRGEIYGAFTVYSQHEHSFDDPDVLQHLSGIASRICVALETARDQQQVMLLSTALSATANGVFITDNTGRIRWVNKAFTLLTGFGEQDALGATPRILNSGKQDSSFFAKMWHDILRGEVWRNEMVDRRKDGSEFFVRQTVTPIRDAHGEISHFIAILEDISAEKEAEARIEHMAHYDSLTNLPNRALFLDRLRQTLASAKRASHPGALMFLDLDRFKSVNDTLGHHAGDVLLQQVAMRIRACVRESDTVARLAGDEFTVILPEITVKEDAARVAEKIFDVFAAPFDLEGHEVFMSTSIGIALFPKDAADEDEMLKRADAAMYAAKEGGRNKFAFFDKDRKAE